MIEIMIVLRKAEDRQQSQYGDKEKLFHIGY